MKYLPALLCVASIVAAHSAAAADQIARPPDRVTLMANGSTLTDTDGGGGGSLSWLHYFTPDALFGVGAEHQMIAESRWTFGSLRAAWGRGQPVSRFGVFGEVHHGQGDDDGRNFDYSVAVLGFSQALGSKVSLQLEGRQIDIDVSHGNLPKLSLSYVWTPRLLTTLSYAHSVGGNLGTELIVGRLDHYGKVNLVLGGSAGQADPAVLNLEPGSTLPTSNSKQGFAGIGKTFKRGELLLMGDYLQLADSEKVTVTLSFTAYLGGTQ